MASAQSSTDTSPLTQSTANHALEQAASNSPPTSIPSTSSFTTNTNPAPAGPTPSLPPSSSSTASSSTVLNNGHSASNDAGEDNSSLYTPVPRNPQPGTSAGTINPTGYTIRKPNNRPAMQASNYDKPPPPSTLSPAPPVAPPTTTLTNSQSAASSESSASQSSAANSSSPDWPALHLIPLNETFVPKQISLNPVGTRVKIGRQTNAKTIPNGTNGYFDSKVLSRMHAEIWAEDGKVKIKDVKSSNGTFIDGTRLSAEALESDVFELETGQTVEFGIDIVSDDGKSIVHHKVAAKVIAVMNIEDFHFSQREFKNWYRLAGEQPQQRRNHRPQGNSVGAQSNGLSFDHVMNRLQTELQKSRDTGSHLGEVHSTLNQVHETLAGGEPAQISQPNGIPSFNSVSHQEFTAQSNSIAALQTQLNDTQSSLSSHVTALQSLEGLLAEHESMKKEVGNLKQEIHSRGARTGRESPIAEILEREEDEEDAADDEDDDARSISSVDTIRDRATRSAKLSREEFLQDENGKLMTRLEALSAELNEATELGHTLQTRHAQAATTISLLEAKVRGLEQAVEGSLANMEAKILHQVELKWADWKTLFEESFQREKLSWHAERQKLESAVAEWQHQKQISDSSEESSEDETAGEATLKGINSSASTSSAAASSSTSSPKSKRSRSRRRRRSTVLPQSEKLNQNEISSLGQRSENASDSSNADTAKDLVTTKGSLTDWSGSGANPARGKSSGARSQPNSVHMLQTQDWVTGAALVVGVAAGWAIALKIKSE